MLIALVPLLEYCHELVVSILRCNDSRWFLRACSFLSSLIKYMLVFISRMLCDTDLGACISRFGGVDDLDGERFHLAFPAIL
jgi:hypothetical protein